jgi:hypothetical protein
MRTVSVRVLTDAGWLTGAVSAPPKRSLAETLAQAPTMLSMLDVWLPGQDFNLPYFAMRSRAVHLVLLEHSEDIQEVSGTFVRTTPQEVVVLVGSSIVSGIAMVPQNLRVSDYFTRQRGFVSLTAATLRMREPGGRQAVLRKCPEILVNAERMVGVAETSG